mgnify:CR=1 FL=1
MASAQQNADAVRRKDIRSRWLLSAPALAIIVVAAVGPLFVMLLYSFMAKGDYGDVKPGSSRSTGGFRSSSSAIFLMTR